LHGPSLKRQDYTEAMKWYQLAAEQGDTMEQVSIGSMSEKGKGVRRNNRNQRGCDAYRRLNEAGY